jgi:hypothetical protein
MNAVIKHGRDKGHNKQVLGVGGRHQQAAATLPAVHHPAL